MDKAACFLDLGVPRLSIGFQSLHDEVLQLFGRVHSAADSFRAFEAARRAGIRHLNVDLIYAVPDQTPDAWSADLARVLDLGPDHLSAYNLTFEEDTRFKRWLDRGRLRAAEEEVELELFHATRQLAAAHGLATERREPPDARARRAETWWLGLRLRDGVEPAAAAARAGADERAAADALVIADRLESSGLLAARGGRYQLGERGLPLADAVAREFLERLPGSSI